MSFYFLAKAFLCIASVVSCHAETIEGRVVGVADGDTITVLDATKTQHKIRLSGIDAPEKKQACGQRSKQSLSNLVFNHVVQVETTKRDRYGREIGKVLVDGLDANLEQVKRGMAWHYKAYQREQSKEDRGAYAAAEDVARGARVGLWRDEQPVAPWEFRRSQHTVGESSNASLTRFALFIRIPDHTSPQDAAMHTSVRTCPHASS